LFKYDEISPSCLVYKQDTKAYSQTKRYEGDFVTGQINCRGKIYWSVKVGCTRMMVHRLIYLLHYRYIKDNHVINHKDGNSLNNKIANLEEVSFAENARRKKLISKTGHVNITRNVRKNVLLGYVLNGRRYRGQGLLFLY